MSTNATLFTPEAYKGFMILGGIIVALSFATIVFILVKFPDYSEKNRLHPQTTQREIISRIKNINFIRKVG